MKTLNLPIPAHFFTSGKFEVWAPGVSSIPFDNSFKKISEGLSAQTALAYEWAGSEIRLNGKVMSREDVRNFIRKERE